MKKGFAISSMLYAMLILFLVILAAILSVIGSQTLILNKLKKNIFDNLNGSNKVEVYKDKSGASYPNLAGDLIPVYYNDETETWNKANVYEEWYDYDKKNWANAVILDDDIIPDISGNGNHGYLQGATRNSGSVTTDGIDDYVYAGLPNHEFKDEFSIVLRTKLLIENEKDGHLFSCAEGAGIDLIVHPNNKISFEAFSTTKGNYVAAYSTGTYSANEFYTIVGTFKDNKLHLYINGKEAAPPVDFNGETKASAVALLIGANPRGSSCNTTNHTCTNTDPSALEFTDALIFDRALSEEEIKYDYAGKITNLSNTSKMILRYDLDDEIKPNTPLPEEIIESHFVWIPKFSYKIFNMGNYDKLETTKPASQVKEIEISFDIEDTSDTTTTCKTPMLSGAFGNCNVNKWMTHPAFLSIPSNGFWIGKFEIGYKGANKTADAEVNATESEKIVIKPNVYSWRNATVYNFFMSAYNYERDLDSHMMKNTEWGAVAYLSHSKYGIGKEVNINNNSKYITGCGANPGSAGSDECNDYKTDLGKGASTTGNIYGVYDMSGGAWEYTASHIEGKIGDSGMDSIVANPSYDKYFDKYSISSVKTSYNYRILGDATGELGPLWDNSGHYQSAWYDDFSDFVDPDLPWFNRGSAYSGATLDGQFAFGRYYGRSVNDFSTRLILTP